MTSRTVFPLATTVVSSFFNPTQRPLYFLQMRVQSIVMYYIIHPTIQNTTFSLATHSASWRITSHFAQYPISFGTWRCVRAFRERLLLFPTLPMQSQDLL